METLAYALASQEHTAASDTAKPVAAAGLLAALLLLAMPAAGQIRIYVNENGKRVYVNADDNKAAAPGKRAGSGRSALSKAGRMTKATGASSGEDGTRTLHTREEIDRLVNEMAERHKVDPALIRAVIEAESNWHLGATSRKGAQGLMQLMPGTAQQLGVNNAYDPRQNIEAGVRYLRALLEKYDGDLDKALAAYNAGEGAVERAGGVPNIPETRAYVQKVTDNYYHPGSGRQSGFWQRPRTIRREVDEHGRTVYTNE